MKNLTPLIVVLLMLVIGVCVFDTAPANVLAAKPKVTIESLSSTRTSDGSFMIYCMMMNRDSVAVTDVEITLQALDSNGVVLYTKELVFFTTDSLRPKQRALFTESFPDCWDCKEVSVVPH